MVPPHSDEAEQSVIGSLLLDNAALDMVPQLEAGHFYHPQYQQTYRVIQRLCAAGKAADVVTVQADGGGDLQTLVDLAQSVPSAANIETYADIVIGRWLERELVRIAGETTSDAQAHGDPIEKIDRAMGKLTKLATGRKASESVAIDAAVLAFLDRLEREASGQTEVISTGLHDLDRLLAGGLRRGELMVLGARPKMGKTAFTLQLARNISRTHGVLICSQEMPVYELSSRHVAALGSINLGEMRRPEKMPDQSWGRISEAVEELRQLKMTMDDQRALKLMDVRRKVMDAKRKGACDVVVVDFLQLMTGDGDNRNQELDRISNGLKAMAGEFDVAVVLLSQLSREADKRHGPPVMTDLRDCGAIEAAADIIAMMYREVAHPLGEKGDMWKHHAQLEVVQRNGAPGTVNLWFSGEFQQFKDWAGAPPMRSSVSRSGGSKARSNGLE